MRQSMETMVRALATVLSAGFMILMFALVPQAAGAETSELWGEYGELWDPDGRLPDFSHAGYKSGREPIPDLPVVTNVRDFGAIGDGTTDDTAAFKAAIEATSNGALLIPEGRYLIRDVLRVDQDNTVLRGEGPDQTIIYIDRSLTDVHGEWRRSFSWGYAFLELVGSANPTLVGALAAPAGRGDRQLTLDTTEGIEAGDLVFIKLVDDAGGSLGRHLHNGQEEASRCNDGALEFTWRARVTAVEATTNRITLDDPLPLDLRLEWSPQVRVAGFLAGAGIENLAVEFPSTTYPGHLAELGYNAIRFVNAMDSWVRNVEVTNADSGVFVNGKHITVENITFHSERSRGPNGNQGHHGVIAGQSNLFQDFHFDATFVHHVTISNQSVRNVFSDIGGTETIRLDHHRRSPIENLFTAFTAPFNYRSGGSGCEGPHAGARNTYWGQRGPVSAPCNVGGSGQCWGHIQSTVVGDLAMADSMTAEREWYENVDSLTPLDLHAAQLERRLAIEHRDARFSPLRFGLRADWEEHDPSRWAVVDRDGDARYALMTTVHDFTEGGGAGEYALAPTPALGDVTITARAKSPEALDQSYRDVVLILGYQDADNYEYAIFNKDVESTAIFAVRGGERQELARTDRSILTDQDWHTVAFRRTGDLLEMFYDGELIVSTAEAVDTPASLPGRVGIGTLNDAAFFDDVEIESDDLPDDVDPASDMGGTDGPDAGPDPGPDTSRDSGGGDPSGGDGGSQDDTQDNITASGGCGCGAVSGRFDMAFLAIFSAVVFGVVRRKRRR